MWDNLNAHFGHNILRACQRSPKLLMCAFNLQTAQILHALSQLTEDSQMSRD